MEDSMASEMDMGPIRPQNFLFACELKAAKEFTFNPDENGSEHQLSLRTVCVDGSTKDELHVVEVEGLNAEGEQIKATLAALKPSVHPTVSLGGFEITPPVVFRLKKGSGPVHISGQHLVALDNDMSSDEDDEDEEEMEDYKTAIKRPANVQATKTIQKKMKLEQDDDEEDDDDYDEEDDEDDDDEEDDDEETPVKTKPPQKTPTKGAPKENGKLSKPSTPAQKQEPKTPDGKGKQGPKPKSPKTPKGPMSVSDIKEKMQSTFKGSLPKVETKFENFIKNCFKVEDQKTIQDLWKWRQTLVEKK
ncbi:nucleophosmin-like [Acipenser oxyrinchus oxyrinchus]|uniref:Nucleophosmin n=1 Tax=Acipenser oxyrinchus oxyrinchus TaxID=40147 RepID=A0AAD8D1Z2_ACIOX|nr:nucleophosmin-like [Acipenser oxyrinchus oxyrinchus]